MMGGALANGERIEIRGFGSFSLHFRPPRTGRNPKTGEEVPIKPRRVLVFRASHVLKDRVNRGVTRGDGALATHGGDGG